MDVKPPNKACQSFCCKCALAASAGRSGSIENRNTASQCSFKAQEASSVNRAEEKQQTVGARAAGWAPGPFRLRGFDLTVWGLSSSGIWDLDSGDTGFKFQPTL